MHCTIIRIEDAERQKNSELLREFVRQFPEFQTDGKVLLCKLCNCSVAAKIKYHVEQHIGTEKHKKLAAAQQPQQQLISIAVQPKRSEFFADLCNAFLKGDSTFLFHFNVVHTAQCSAFGDIVNSLEMK